MITMPIILDAMSRARRQRQPGINQMSRTYEQHITRIKAAKDKRERKRWKRAADNIKSIYGAVA